MSKLKICCKCKKAKDSEADFYCYRGVYRTECRCCTVHRNVLHQQKVKAWRGKDVDPEIRRSYMRKYYSENKEKFSEYREKFRKKHPEYYKNYFRKRKEK